MEEIYSKEYINKIIGSNIRCIRKSKKLSQEKFGEKVSLSTQFVSDVERGLEGISLITSIRICNEMECSPLILFANLINFDGYDNKMDQLTKLTEKNKAIVNEIVEALINNQ